MKKLLITGFEPFGGEIINPSWQAVKQLSERINGYELYKLELPVVFGLAFEKALAIANEVNPSVVLCIGQAGGRNAITPEFVAINIRHATIPDNNGNQPKDEPIILGGDNAYFSTLPVRKMAEAIRAEDIPSQVSYSAGAYVCNDLFYSLLAHFKGSSTRVGFIHIPYCEEQNKQPSMPLTTIISALTVAIGHIDD
jgi:pyroglutamyl-peptidase